MDYLASLPLPVLLDWMAYREIENGKASKVQFKDQTQMMRTLQALYGGKG